MAFTTDSLFFLNLGFLIYENLSGPKVYISELSGAYQKKLHDWVAPNRIRTDMSSVK